MSDKKEEGVREIVSIENMAVFQNFQWNKDSKNKIEEFQKINILYGQNYSGKTTLSRIFRALETGSLLPEYSSSKFELSLKNGENITQESLKNHDQEIRVFNTDFVKENLRFLSDDKAAIESFAILGKENIKLEENIKEHEAELGDENNNLSLHGELSNAEKEFTRFEKEHKNYSKQLDDKLSAKSSEIKNNRSFGDANYNFRRIETDIEIVRNGDYELAPEKIGEFHDLLGEKAEESIPELSPFSLQYSVIVENAKELIEKKIQASAPLLDLINDAALATWVRTGREYHQGRDTCAFCGSDLPKDLWEKLDRHFNKESEELRQELEALLGDITREQEKIDQLPKIERAAFYFELTAAATSLAEEFSAQKKSYCAALDSIKKQIEERKDQIFIALTFTAPESVEKSLNAVRDSFEQLRNESNQFTASLSEEQDKARNALRLHEVFEFIKEIEEIKKSIEELQSDKDKAEKDKNEAKEKVATKERELAILKGQRKDESMGAERVNEYLQDSGIADLSLKAITENTPAGSSPQYRFEVTRNEKKAHHLSEGECNLLAFCYFMAKLEDIETKGKKPIIWLDDPISSLDANHIFFVHSLIVAKIVQGKNFLQLFISTHSLEFLKYLKRLPGGFKSDDYQYFKITRTKQGSAVTLMPKYMKEYATEFNYLFHQIYKCANATEITDANYQDFYNFGNNARKFLETFLYYKYPQKMELCERLELFFGEGQDAFFVNRFINEFSHANMDIEKIPSSETNSNVIEQAAAKILQKIKEKGPDQYEALCNSVGVSKEFPEVPAKGAAT